MHGHTGGACNIDPHTLGPNTSNLISFFRPPATTVRPPSTKNDFHRTSKTVISCSPSFARRCGGLQKCFSLSYSCMHGGTRRRCCSLRFCCDIDCGCCHSGRFFGYSNSFVRVWPVKAVLLVHRLGLVGVYNRPLW
eukprot:357287-Chlamydomonas_euryale.AAC.3